MQLESKYRLKFFLQNLLQYQNIRCSLLDVIVVCKIVMYRFLYECKLLEYLIITLTVLQIKWF